MTKTVTLSILLGLCCNSVYAIKKQNNLQYNTTSQHKFSKEEQDVYDDIMASFTNALDSIDAKKPIIEPDILWKRVCFLNSDGNCLNIIKKIEFRKILNCFNLKKLKTTIVCAFK